MRSTRPRLRRSPSRRPNCSDPVGCMPLWPRPIPYRPSRTPWPMCNAAARCCSMWPPAERARARDEFAAPPMTRRCAGRPIHSDQETDMTKTTPEQNKVLVLEAFDTLFNKRDYAAAERFWSTRYIQHSANIEPGREVLFDLIRSAPAALRYENQLIVAEGDFVIAHGRFSGNGRPAAWIAADVVRIEDGKLAEHWDVLQDEATKAESVSGLPMFGDRFPA